MPAHAFVPSFFLSRNGRHGQRDCFHPERAGEGARRETATGVAGVIIQELSMLFGSF